MNTLPPPSSVNHAGTAQWLAMATCLFFGSLQEIMPLYDEVYWLTLVAISAVSVYTLMRCVFTPITVSIWDYFAGMVGMMYGLGTLNTELTGISSYRDLSMLTSAPVIYVHESLGYVSVLVGLLLLVGLFTKERLLEGLSPDKLNATGILFFGFGTALICLILVATGTIGYHGDVLEENSITPSAAATYAIFCLAPAAAAQVFMWQRYNHGAKIIATLSLLAFLAVALYLGRRNIIYTGVVCAIAHFAATRNERVFNRQSIIAIVSAALLLPIITTGFMAMRLASYEVAEKDKKPTVWKIATAATDIILRDKGEVDRQSTENLKERTYLIGYLAELNWRTEVLPPLKGDLFLYNVAMSVPNALWIEKFRFVRDGSEEALAHPRLGMPAWDAANSVLTTGMTDFGPIGMLTYPIGVVVIYALLLRLLRRLNISIYFLMSFSFLMALANIEGQMLAYFTHLRDVILVSTTLFIVTKAIYFLLNYNNPKLQNSNLRRPNRRRPKLFVI
jgi:hypothetical protein